MQDILERRITSYMHRLFVILDENMSVASAVRQMQSHNADTIIVLRGNTPTGIVTDRDIIDKVVMKGEDSDEVFLKSIMSAPATYHFSKRNRSTSPSANAPQSIKAHSCSRCLSNTRTSHSTSPCKCCKNICHRPNL